MGTFLFDKIIFGPVKSRRLGVSLGINLLPTDSKVCSFNCIYCECGLNPGKHKKKAVLPTREEVKSQLFKKLNEMAMEGQLPDVITFAGNGEPTLHPDFAGIIDDTVMLRNQLAPKARVAVLSNSTKINKKDVFEALLKVEDNILKLDSAFPETIELLDCPVGKFNLDETVEQLTRFKGNVTIQTMFVKGIYKGKELDNSVDKEVNAWLALLKIIKPGMVMIYTIERDTPNPGLEKVSKEKLQEIAKKVEGIGLKVQVSG